MDAKAKVVGRIDGVAGVDRMWDSQWVNVVNHDNCYRGWAEEDAIAHAVRMTEQYMAANHKQAMQTLLTGLEVLAGEWEAENFFGAGEQLRERIRTLTNSAKGNDHG